MLPGFFSLQLQYILPSLAFWYKTIVSVPQNETQNLLASEPGVFNTIPISRLGIVTKNQTSLIRLLSIDIEIIGSGKRTAVKRKGRRPLIISAASRVYFMLPQYPSL